MSATPFQRLPVGQLVGPGNAPVDFLVRPTILGVPLGLVGDAIPTPTATAPSFVSSAGVKFGGLSYFKDGNGAATIRGTVSFTPSTTATSGAYGTFTVAMPNRTTNFAAKDSAVTIAAGAYDDNDSNVYGVFARPITGSTNVLFNFFPNSATILHYIPFNFTYTVG